MIIDLITILERTYLEGEIKAKYRGELLEGDSSFEKDYIIEIYEATIHEGKTIITKDQKIQLDAAFTWLDCPDIKGAKVHLPEFQEEDEIFALDLTSVSITSPILSNIEQEGNSTFGELSGTISALVDEQRKLKSLSEIEPLVVFHPEEKIKVISNKTTAEIEVELDVRQAGEMAITESPVKLPDGGILTNVRLVKVWIVGDIAKVILSGKYIPPPAPPTGPENTLVKDEPSTTGETISFGDVIREIFNAIPWVLSILFALLILVTIINGIVALLGWQNLGILIGVLLGGYLISLIPFVHNLPWKPLFSFGRISTRVLMKIARWTIWIFCFVLLFTSYTSLAIIFGVLGLVIWISSFQKDTSTTSFGLSGLGIIAAVIILFSGLATLTSTADRQYARAGTTTTFPITVTDTIVNPQDSQGVSPTIRLVHHLQWTDLLFDKHEGKLVVYPADMAKAETFMARYASGNNFSYQSLYKYILQEEGYLHQELIALIDSIQNLRQYNQIDLAGLIVTMVQEIPYVFIMDGSCPNNTDAPCVAQVPFGLYTPKQFTYTLAGDCDTRALMLYAILDHYGYQVAILASEYYAHAMLGIDLPISGYHLKQGNNRYYFWETTTKGWTPGQLSPEIRNLDLWDIYLSNQKNI
ncbi:hypothetical protein [Lewinella sp. LCG006]|uniref:hypothetical protein n=1 Tax=Lewinella sp. LCG006 TaxID=3231911 RepID=UPI00345F3A86